MEATNVGKASVGRISAVNVGIGVKTACVGRGVFSITGGCVGEGAGVGEAQESRKHALSNIEMKKEVVFFISL